MGNIGVGIFIAWIASIFSYFTSAYHILLWSNPDKEPKFLSVIIIAFILMLIPYKIAYKITEDKSLSSFFVTIVGILIIFFTEGRVLE